MSKNILKLKITLFVSIVLLTCITVTYAAFYAVDKQENENTLSTSCFDVKFTDGESINISGAIPMSDAQGMYEAPYEFSIVNNCSYDISFKVIANTQIDSIDNAYMKYMFDSNVIGIVAHALESDETSDLYQTPRILGEKEVKGRTKVTEELRFWLDENTDIESVRNKTWNTKIQVKVIPKGSNQS